MNKKEREAVVEAMAALTSLNKEHERQLGEMEGHWVNVLPLLRAHKRIGKKAKHTDAEVVAFYEEGLKQNGKREGAVAYAAEKCGFKSTRQVWRILKRINRVT